VVSHDQINLPIVWNRRNRQGEIAAQAQSVDVYDQLGRHDSVRFPVDPDSLSELRTAKPVNPKNQGQRSNRFRGIQPLLHQTSGQSKPLSQFRRRRAAKSSSLPNHPRHAAGKVAPSQRSHDQLRFFNEDGCRRALKQSHHYSRETIRVNASGSSGLRFGRNSLLSISGAWPRLLGRAVWRQTRCGWRFFSVSLFMLVRSLTVENRLVAAIGRLATACTSPGWRIVCQTLE